MMPLLSIENDCGATIEIRGPEVTLAVSPVSAVPAVRELLVAEQRRIIAEALEQAGGIVVEGRDIGTRVFPDTPHKFFLDARADVRGRRRFQRTVFLLA